MASQVTFFTVQDRKHHGRPLADWLVHLAKEFGLHGATVIAAAEGFGHHSRIHSARFFELAMVLSGQPSCSGRVASHRMLPP